MSRLRPVGGGLAGGEGVVGEVVGVGDRRCEARGRADHRGVVRAERQRHELEAQPASLADRPISASAAPASVSEVDVIARVGTKVITKDQLLAPMIEAHGLNYMLLLAQLELARIDRACDLTDVIDNVSGAVIGVAIGIVLMLLLRPWRHGRSPSAG